MRGRGEDDHLVVGYNLTNSEGEPANLDDARRRSDAGDVRGNDRSDYTAAAPPTLWTDVSGLRTMIPATSGTQTTSTISRGCAMRISGVIPMMHSKIPGPRISQSQAARSGFIAFITDAVTTW